MNDGFEPISILKAKYIKRYEAYAMDLFSGFTDLKVITFSYGLSFIEKISELFDNVEIVLGKDTLVKNDVREVMAQQNTVKNTMAFQEASILMIRKHKKLQERAINGEISFWISKNLDNHSKIFIMKNRNTGETRVVVGSANCSKRAFDGSQLEEYLEFDDEDSYSDFLFAFETAKDISSNKVIVESLLYRKPKKNSATEENDDIAPEDLPICQETKVRHVDIIVEQARDPEEVEYAVQVSKKYRKYDELLPKFKKSGSKVSLTGKDVKEIQKRHFQRIEERKNKEKESPRITVDQTTGAGSFCGKSLPSPDPEAVSKEAAILIHFFDGFKSFLNYSPSDSDAYYKTLVYMLAAPYIASLRAAAYSNDFAVTLFPYVLTLKGRKSSGKTTFVNMVQRLMTGKKISDPSASCFTKTDMSDRMAVCKGFPIHVNDLTQSSFKNNSGPIIKNLCDDLLTDQSKYENHSILVITTNDICSPASDIAKRMPFFELNLYDQDVKAAAGKKIRSSMRELKGAFYSEYLKRMTPKVFEMIAEMEEYVVPDDEPEWCPDIFDLSSKTILEIFQDYLGEVPDFCKILNYADYFGYQVRTEQVRQKLLQAWNTSPESFEINRKANQVTYHTQNQWEPGRIGNPLSEAFPVTISHNCLIIPLDKLEEFLGIRLKVRRWIRKFR